MKRFLLLALAVAAIAAGPTITPPGDVKAKPGRMARFVVGTTGKVLKYINPSEADADLFREYDPDPNSYVYRFLADKPGTYKVWFYTAAGDVPSEPAAVTITVEGVVPPPGPGPAPGPSPADDLTTTLKVAYGAEADPNKAAQLVQLSALYRVAAQSAVADEAIPDTAALLARMHAARQAILPDTALRKVIAAIGGELNKTLSKPAPLDAAKRAEIAALFNRIAAALDAVK